MRMIFGCLMFLATAAFAAALVFTLVSASWYALDSSKALIGFFGFGVPMAICAMVTAELWWDSTVLLRALGAAAGLASLVLAACLFVLVGGWVFGHPFPATQLAGSASRPRAWYFLSFAIPMVAAGILAAVVVVEAERKK